MIEVKAEGGGDPLEFSVRLRDSGGETRHSVTMTRASLELLASDVAPETAVEAAFAFLLDREPKEAILSRFDVSVISRYFPEFEREWPRYVDRAK